MISGNVVYKGFIICVALFCAYMQWSPVVDFNYVWINGHEHCVGAADSHQIDGMAMSAPTPPVGAFPDNSAFHLLTLPAIQSTERPVPSKTLRL
jgi:hypothetical protein